MSLEMTLLEFTVFCITSTPKSIKYTQATVRYLQETVTVAFSVIV